MMRGLACGLKCSGVYVKRRLHSDALYCLKRDHRRKDGKGTITSLCKLKLFKDALRAFDVLEKNPEGALALNTYAHLFSACSSLKSLEYGRRIHNHVLKWKLLPNVILENHIISMYGKCGSMEDAREVFDKMSERNVVTWSALVAGYSQNVLYMEAINLYLQMQRCGVTPDDFALGSAIKACASSMDAKLGAQLHCQVIKADFGSHGNGMAQNALIAMYTKFGRINEACEVFSRMMSKDLISWSSMIAGFSKHGYELEALYCFKDLLFQGICRLNEFTFGSVFRACGSLDQPEYGRQIHGISIKYGFRTDNYVGCSLTDMYAKCSFFSSARTVFDKIENPDVASWNAMIYGFAHGDHRNEALSVFSQMRHLGSVPDFITVCCLLCGFNNPSALSQGQQVHAYAIKTGLDLDLPVCNTLLTMYAKCLNYVGACKMFGFIKDTVDIVSWNAMITMCTQQHWIAKVFLLFRNMLFFHITPDHYTLSSVLRACGKVSALQMGERIICYAIKYGLNSDVMVVNELIDMYVKCGSLEKGRKIFDSMGNSGVFSWPSLFVGYVQFGHAEEAVNLFRQMKNKGIKLNQVTLVRVLKACSHVELVEEGLQLLNSIEQDHKVRPTVEHFSCAVDLLARAGHVHDAEAFIKQMGFDPDTLLWKTILASCRSLQAAENIMKIRLLIGKRATENIDDPSLNSAAAVDGIYTPASNSEDVDTLRSSMREKDVKKVMERSWIEVRDGIHVFWEDGKHGFHPERDKVFAMLEELWLQILDDGFVPLLE